MNTVATGPGPRSWRVVKKRFISLGLRSRWVIEITTPYEVGAERKPLIDVEYFYWYGKDMELSLTQAEGLAYRFGSKDAALEMVERLQKMGLLPQEPRLDIN